MRKHIMLPTVKVDSCHSTNEAKKEKGTNFSGLCKQRKKRTGWFYFSSLRKAGPCSALWLGSQKFLHDIWTVIMNDGRNNDTWKAHCRRYSGITSLLQIILPIVVCHTCPYQLGKHGGFWKIWYSITLHTTGWNRCKRHILLYMAQTVSLSSMCWFYMQFGTQFGKERVLGHGSAQSYSKKRGESK